eukprot:TRINITY_DN23163_c0_g1_i1.p1 TRINITY_DN23163_c0_g1~~TRINITY_DN23163_c0_g1_i1.p1  ORF type:complete len:529 (-),score=66.56 TRINITY_DN23163_c0_g1_i1:211-1749(-)
MAMPSQRSQVHQETVSHALTYGRTQWSVTMMKPPLDRLFPGRRQPGARQALFTFTAISALSVADRFMPSAVKPDIKASFQLSDVETTFPDFAMKIVFMVCSLVFGSLADKQVCDRRVLLAVSVALWSLATALGGFAQNLTQLILFRSVVGVGEAAFATLSYPMLADFYPPVWRNRAYTILGLAAPFGAAVGFGLGSMIDSYTNWRYAFMVCGFPGILMSLAVLALNEPPVGINDESYDEGTESDTESSTYFRECVDVIRNPYWLLAPIGLVAIQFAIGGLTEWYPSYMSRVLDMSRGFSGLVLAATTTIGGIAGTLSGSKLADKLFNKFGFRSYLMVPALFTIPAALFVCLAVNVHVKPVVIGSLLLGQTCFFTYTAPLNAWSVSVIPPESRSRASALQNVLLHVFGDLLSASVVGAISDATGSLQTGMQITYVSIAVAGLFWLFCWCLKDPEVFTEEEKKQVRHLTIGSVLRQAPMKDLDTSSTSSGDLPAIPETDLEESSTSSGSDRDNI